MIIWRQELNRYLNIRRGLGYDLHTAERILWRFIAFADAKDASHLTVSLLLQWLETAGHIQQYTKAEYLGAIRPFATWLHGFDPTHEILPRSLIPGRRKRPTPYIYGDDDIRRIVEAAAELLSINGIRALTCATLFGLIAVTGLRISEAISLDDDDIDLETGVLTVRNGKRGRERVLPLSNSTIRHLAAYAAERDRLCGHRPDAFFIGDRGQRLTDCSARYNFAAACQRIGLRQTTRFHRHGNGPRIHDLRHSFAVRTIIDWYRTGKDPGREMMKLSTYLGHTKPVHTYWYIEAVPELLELASLRASGIVSVEAQS